MTDTSRRVRPFLLGAVGLVVFAVVWQLAAGGPLADTSFPYAWSTLRELGELVRTAEFWNAVVSTLAAAGTGFALAAVIGVPLGLIVGSSRFVEAVLRIPLEVAKPIPPIVILPLVVYELGPTASMSRFLIIVGLVPTIVVATAAGVRDVDPLQIETARSFRLGTIDRSVRIVLPAATPFIVTGLRIASFGALLTAVMSEIVGGAPGLGAHLTRARRANLPERAYAYVIAIAVVGLVADRLLTAVERQVLHWHVSVRGESGSPARYRIRPPRAVADAAARLIHRVTSVADRVGSRGQRRPRWRFTGPVISVTATALLVAWWWRATSGSTSLLFRPLSDIVDRFREIWLFDRFVSDGVPSVRNLAVGFSIATVVGVALGVVIALLRPVREVLGPVLALFRSLPGVAFVPILITVMGFGTGMRVTTIALSSTFPILIATVDGIRGVESGVHDVARSYRIPFWRRLRAIYLPAALPRIFTGLEIGLATAVVVMVASELSGVTVGIGAQTILAQNTFEFSDMWAGVILLALVGLVSSAGFRVVQHVSLGWYRGWRKSAGAA